jgi:hypothetical protein
MLVDHDLESPDERLAVVELEHSSEGPIIRQD